MILIVDDKQENLFSLKSLLQLSAYEVETATNAYSFFKLFFAHLIPDVQMPGMDAIKATYSKN